ncbi:MAG: hypothetical protein ACP5GD_01730 [Candidatus Micrarchaeia archaeon]
MIDAIVAAIEGNKVVVMPTGGEDEKGLVGKEAIYTDSNNKEWHGKVVGIEEAGLVVEFDSFPTSIGQGQIISINES